MGLIRLLLAVSVVIAHAGPLYGLTLIGGKMAVQSFFIISGFYMALILHEKYIGKHGSYKLYITNRLLRIFPLYWFILFLTCLLCVLFHNGIQTFFQIATSYHPLTTCYLIITNIFIFGQDLGMFLELIKEGRKEGRKDFSIFQLHMKGQHHLSISIYLYHKDGRLL